MVKYRYLLILNYLEELVTGHRAFSGSDLKMNSQE